MDIETAEAVDTPRTDIHCLEHTLTVRIERLETAMTTKIEKLESSLIVKMDEQQRDTDIRLQSMHDDVRMLAGHVASLSEKFDSRR